MDDDTLKKSQKENSFHNLIALYERESNSTVNDAFDCISVSLCICDISEIFLELQKYKLANVTDIKTHLIANPHLVKLLIAAIRLINVNRATMTLFKFNTLSESQEHNLHHLLSESIAPLLEAAEAIWTGQDYFSTRILLRDSEQKPFTALLSFYPPKSLIESKCLCVTILNITEDIEQEQRLKAVTNALPDLTFITAEDGTTLEVMSSQQHLLYKPKDTVVGKKMHEIIPGEVGQSILNTIKTTIETNEKQLLEYPLKINDTLCWFEGSCSAIQGEFKGQRAAVWLAREITDKKNLEVHLRHAQKMQAIGSLSGGIAHEFNNLLSPILGYSDLMLQNKNMSQFEQHAIELINSASKRASELVKQLMAYGGRTMSQRTEVNLGKLTTDLLPLIKSSLGGRITLSADINPDIPTVFGVADDLKQAIINICDNAKNAMPQGGRLHIRQTTEERADRVNRQYYVALHITDSGSGIPLEILDRIFDPFFTTKGIGEGTGLGLSVVYGIVEQHQGKVEIKSKANEGTTVSMLIPVSHKLSDDSNDGNNNELKNKPRIMVVDDDPMVLELITVMLKHMEYRVTALDSAVAAGDLLKHAKFDLLITDFSMPDLNGADLVRYCRKHKPDMATLMMTGYSGSEISTVIADIQPIEILKKPFDMDVLLKTLNQVIA